MQEQKGYTGLQQGMKLSLAANFVLNWVWPVLSFPERFQPITAAAMCTVAINVLKPGAFNTESEYFIPLFNKIMSCPVYKWVLKSHWTIQWRCTQNPQIYYLSYMWWSKLYRATQMSSKVYKWPNLKAQFCALVRTSWTNLETTNRCTGVGCLLNSLLVTLLHDHDKKQHEGAICTCIHCHCVLGSPEPPAINLHLDPDPQGRWCWMKIKIPYKIM